MLDPLADLARLEGVATALAAATAAADSVLRDRGLRAIGGDELAATALAGARASAELTDDPAGWSGGAVRLARELPALSRVVRMAPLQALARAHTLAASGRVPDAALGRLRGDAQVADRVSGLGDLLVAKTAAPALVLAAVAHAEVAVVEPFGSADGLVARALERMVLMATGFDPVGVILTEVGHAADPAAYARGLEAYRTGAVEGVRHWILHCAEAVAAGARRTPLPRSNP